MAVSANTVWELRTTATPGMVNGGGFVTGATGTDFSLQDDAQFPLTGVTSAGAGNIFLSASAADSWVGNIVHVISGTNFTAGWFEIISVVVGVSATCGTNGAGTAISVGVGANGVLNIGGALDLTGALPDSFFEQINGGNIVYVKTGTYTIGSTIAVASVLSTTTAPSKVIGYNASRTDSPKTTTRPVWDFGATLSITPSTSQYFYNIIITGAAANVVLTATNQQWRYCKFINTSTTASRTAVGSNTTNNFFACEFISQNGNGFVGGGATAINCRFWGCYFHDSNIGMALSGNTASTVVDFCLFESIKTTCISGGANTNSPWISNCTFYGAETTKLGTGIDFIAGAILGKLWNNIFYGLVLGVNQITLQEKSNDGAFNNFFNNTGDVSRYTKDATDLAVDPGFTGATQLTGATATVSGSVLTQAGGNFSTVTDNVDYCRIVSGTTSTPGIYLITNHTTTTLTLGTAPGDSAVADKVWVVPTGHNFAVGTNLKGTGFPGIIYGSETTGYLDTGAAQRVEPAAGGSFSFVG